ncbi:dual specificity protein phosphatase family protein [Rhizobium sp. BK251]|uniref:dual specificity protein phosphatase family protein n=1 Tax=Rhizobium sp. BK251 TaxID=2512125 RepID=UPI0010527841|nr:dual specificity protein phosphatase family protein [Rhizobium sp. BK251]TCL67302.1 protein tyrosine/serine phosphatase [Rhizobium sp. BK251]
MSLLSDRFHKPLKARTVLHLAAVVLVAVGVYLAYLQLSTNVHAVVPGQLYRSSQPSPEKLGDLVNEYGIKTVINLRGDDAGHSWYDNEVEAARKLNLKHIDFRMSAARELSMDEAKQLMTIMATAEKPILIHCRAGADRTGLASAIYVAGIARLGEMAAESQISLTYGHLSLFFIGAYAMDRTFEKLEPMFGFMNS